ncbi:MAG: hypothetical protein ABR555_10390 [Pyrinomonadaceae bacterium]
MGKRPRHKPRRLGKKLQQIRHAQGLSQTQILKEMGLEGKYERNNLSNFETNKREPPMIIVLGYARLAGIDANLILDDKAQLPKEILIASRTSQATKKREQSKKR